MNKNIVKDRNNLSKELKSIQIYTSGITTPMIKDRIQHLLDWYMRKATFYKCLFYTLSSIVIFINTFIPVISQLSIEKKDIVVSVISSIAAVITSIVSLFTMKETWFRYRNHVELIKQECIKCITKIDQYSEHDKDNDREKLLIKNIELIISNERILWGKEKFNEQDNKSKR